MNIGGDLRSEATNSEIAKDVIDSELPAVAVYEPAKSEAEAGPESAAEIKTETKSVTPAMDLETVSRNDIYSFEKATQEAQKKAKFSTEFHQSETLPEDLYDTLNFTPTDDAPTFGGKFDPNSFLMFQDPTDLPSYFIDTSTAAYMPRILGNPSNSLNPEK